MGLEGSQVLSKKMRDDQDLQHQHWLAISDDNDNVSDQSRFSESSSMEGSTNSKTSWSSSELLEDATSSSSSSSSLLLADHANEPLYELSELMAQLPVKRGLSKFYQGKSQSHTSLASVKSLEDLAKKRNHRHKTKIKSSKSYCWGLDVQKSCISKNKGSSGSVLSSLRKKAGSSVAVSSRDRLTFCN